MRPMWLSETRPPLLHCLRNRLTLLPIALGYPGARVDSPVPIYELSIPEVYKDWTWSTNYPEWSELQAYFDHVDKTLDLSKDSAFETVVTSAEFDEKEAKWTVKTQDGRTVKCRFLIVAAGFAAKRCKTL